MQLMQKYISTTLTKMIRIFLNDVELPLLTLQARSFDDDMAEQMTALIRHYISVKRSTVIASITLWKHCFTEKCCL